MAAPSPQNRREVILDATLTVIGTGGVDSVTHRRVAGEAGVALGSIAYHFDSRDEVVRAAFRHFMEGVARSVAFLDDRFVEGGERELLDALVALSERDLERPATTRAEYEMLVYGARDPELAREVNSWQKTLDARLAEGLEALGVVRPLEGARAMRGALRGFELERLIRPGSTGLELRRRLQIVLAGLLAQDEEPIR
ncbi:MAG: hypothetical protein CL910_06125 [Deltaproteobacteria bacterium]|jgi:DNA-binding transcriptional regulator YbjK|nr:hypothetical protein [Deltaproteobacteria bacterium]